MRGSDLFNGESFGLKYLDGATYKFDSLNIVGTVVNVTDEKGFFSISDTGSSQLELIVDGNKLTGKVTELFSVLGGISGTNRVFALEYKNSLRVNMITASGTVVISRFS